jgi:protein TonB
VVAAIAFWGWQNSETAVDWFDGEPWADAKGPMRAKADLLRIFSTDDYPMEAIRREEQGTTAYRLTVSRRGRVTGCEITSSSGSSALDSQTCRILTRRARFEPARDVQGKRIADTYSGRIRWELPEK